MEDGQLADLEYRAEFEREQFLLYEPRRLAAETNANAVIAAALAVAAFVLSDYARTGHPPAVWFIFGLAGLAWTLVFANVARTVAWTTRWWLGGMTPVDQVRPSDRVGTTLEAVRAPEASTVGLREKTVEHWHARALSAWQLGVLKDRRLRQSLWGFVGPLAYFAAQLAL